MSHRPKKQIPADIPHNSPTELYQVLFEQAADGIFIADAQGRFIEHGLPAAQRAGGEPNSSI